MKKIVLASLIVFGSIYSTNCAAQDLFFDSLSTGMTSPGGYVLSLTMEDTTAQSPLYAGGHFTIAGRDTAINIAKWIDTGYNNNGYGYPNNTGKWITLGTGVDSDVCALAMYANYLYAGGKFDSAGGVASSHIARWDTVARKWDSLTGKLNGNVYALCVYNNALYVGGDFTLANGDTVNRIAVWKNNTWSAVGKGFDTGAVYTLTVSNDTLYAGGSFLKSGGDVLNHIAKWNGASWSSLGSGTNNKVYALADWNDELYVGGAFTKAGGMASGYISKYDDYYSFQWNSMKGAVNDTVRALCSGYFPVVSIGPPKQRIGRSNGNMLMVGGNFDSARGYPDKYFTIYGWPVDSLAQLSGPVYALAAAGYFSNYIGGKFSEVTNNTPYSTEILNNVAVLGFYDLGGGGVQNITDKSDVNVYPNPSNGVFNVGISGKEQGISKTQVEVYNVLGEKVYSQFNIQNPTLNINLFSQPNGIYLYRVIDENSSLLGEGKLVIER